MSLSSEFDIFAPRPILTSIVERAEVMYKPIASTEHSSLKFLIHGDSDTYVDINKKLYIWGKPTKADGTKLGKTDLTAVTNNFLHLHFSQYSIALKRVTQDTELHDYRSYFKTLFTQ